MWLFTLELKFLFLSFTRYISSAQDLYVASGFCIEQHRTYPSPIKCLLESTGLST